jgi:PIN domain nuclease of toxin-antitoxin system
VELLLDSHVALWWATDPSRLEAKARHAVTAAGNGVSVSTASAWELAIKVRSGRLELDVGHLFEALASHGLRVLGIGVDDGLRAGGLDWSHRDPFDRMLVAQALRLGLTVATRDAAILGYREVPTLAS